MQADEQSEEIHNKLSLKSENSINSNNHFE